MSSTDIAANGSSSSKKNTKAFSGCWTCRVRKVKCDEAKPDCLQCRRKGTQCAGYGVRLQWVNEHSKDDDVDLLTSMLPPRSRIMSNINTSVLTHSRVDQILNTLDSLDSCSRRKTAVATKDVSVFIDCFGVFAASEKIPSTLPAQTYPQQCSTQGTTEDSLEEVNLNISSVVDLLGDISTLSSWSSLSPCNLGDGEAQPLNQASACFLDGGVDSSLTEISDPYMIESDHHVRGDEVQSSPTSYSDNLTAASFILTPTPFFPSRKERFLMHHYSKRVLYLFCVVDHEKSPWKSIHLPKALLATGELTVEGTTSRIRSALANTLLATSAFLLSNDNNSSHRADAARSWATTAHNYRCKAIQLLRDAVENDFSCKSPPKYKTFLATTLSMITMNVISGDIETCGIHLDGAFRLITHAQKWKHTYSLKAQSLHRIYFYLRAIYESTASRQSRADRRPSLSNEAYRLGTSRQEDIFCRPLLEEHMRGYKLGLDLDFEPRITNCERIYGIPHSLLYLLTRVIDLIDKIQDAASTGTVPEHLAKECDELEQSILTWPEVTHLAEKISDLNSASSRIVHHHTLAFHNALIIYFAQHISLIRHRFLKPYVTAVLESMEAIEMLKIGTETLAAPLFWPAFIAGSEAFDKDLQDRFRLWYKHMQIYRIESLRTGIEVLTEIWEAGPETGHRTTCYWRAAVERLGIKLMLS